VNERRAGGLVVAAVLLLAAFVLPVARVPGGGVTLEGFWLSQAAFAVAVIALGHGTRLQAATRLAAALLLGAAAQLSLHDPHWLQHLYLRPNRLVQGVRPLALLVLAGQVLFVASRLRGRFADVRRALGTQFPPRAALLAIALYFSCAVHVTPMIDQWGSAIQVAGYVVQLVAVGAFFALNVAHVWLLAEALPPEPLERARDWLAQRISLADDDESPPRPWDRRVPWLLALFVLLAASATALLVFQRMPHIPDEVCYLFQAHAFTSGHLTHPAPPVAEAFQTYLIQFEGARWFATTNPGWPAVLALGTKLGVPWLVNPVLGALTVPVVHAIFRRLGGRGFAHLGALLLATSPWFIFLSASLMTHSLQLLLAFGAFALLAPGAARASIPRTLAAGLALGAVVVVRPLDGLIAGVLAGVWLLFLRKDGFLRVGSYVVGCVLGAAPLFIFNRAVTGNAMLPAMTPYLADLWGPGVNAYGFGKAAGNTPVPWGYLDPLPGHWPQDAVINANQNLYGLNFELFGWPLGSLFLLGVHLLLGKLSRVDRFMAWATGAVIVTYSGYWFSGGPDFGARYWSLVLVPCVWWTARGLATLAGVVAGWFELEHATLRCTALLAVLMGCSVFTFGPWRAVGKYVDYRHFHADYLRLLEDGQLGNALVLVRTDADKTVADFSSAFVLNHPDLPDDRPIFAHSLDPDIDRRLIDAFPDRPVIRLDGRTITGGCVRIVEPEEDR